MLLRFTFIISRFQSSFSVFYFTFCFFFPSYSVSPFSESSSTIYTSPVRAVASVLFPIWSRIQSMGGSLSSLFPHTPGPSHQFACRINLIPYLLPATPPPQRTPFSTTFPLLFFYFIFTSLILVPPFFLSQSLLAQFACVLSGFSIKLD